MAKWGTYFILLTALILVFSPVACFSEEWYEKGTLHKSTIADWKGSTSVNRLATAADWALASSKKIKQNVIKSGTMDTAKNYGSELVTCINGAVSDHTNWDHESSATVAIMCMQLMGWLK